MLAVKNKTKIIYAQIIFSYWLFLFYRRYVVMVNKKPSGWFHLTIVYNNYDNDYNMEVYYDAEAVGTMHTIADTQPSNASSGNMTVGRLEYDSDGNYATLEIDELTLWNN